MYTNGIYQPKISLRNENTNIELILGAGTTNGTSRFYLIKQQTGAAIVYITSYGQQIGFGFNDNGTITRWGEWA